MDRDRKKAKAELGIEAVAQRSGLSQHLIRIWERRYGAVRPRRTESNRRLYSESDGIRLELLNRAVQAGHRISDIAQLSTSKLEHLVKASRLLAGVVETKSGGTKEDYVGEAIGAVKRLDPESLGAVLSAAHVNLGQARSLEQVIMPLMEKIGDHWKEGEIQIANEHMATAVVVQHVGSTLANSRYNKSSPVLVTATPQGQLHEVGALAVGVAAALEGWRPIFLGGNLPAEEIAGAAQKSKARAVALSIVYPSDDPRLAWELVRLKKALPPAVAVFAGGRGVEGYRAALEEIGVVVVSDLSDLRRKLELIRSVPAAERRSKKDI